MATVAPREYTLETKNGVCIGVKEWGSGPKRVLGLHGWLDNAATFDRLAPLLPLADITLLAVDFVGHGKADWRPPGVPYDLHLYVQVR